MSTHRDVKLGSNRADHSIRQNPLLLDIARRGDENPDRLHERTPRFDSIPYHRHHLQEFGWTLEASRRVFLKEHLKENDERLRDTSELFNRQGDALMLIHRLSGRAPEWRLARQHLPERHAKRVEIRTDVYVRSRELLGTGELLVSLQKLRAVKSWSENLVR